jgi:hypothetical protein
MPHSITHSDACLAEFNKKRGIPLDNYLGDFETINQVYQDRLLTEDQLCVSFSYYVTITAKNAEIQKYAENYDFFGGLQDLTSAVTKSTDKNCH